MTDLERKQFAMMFTDIFGYSRLMSHDESKALKMLSEHDRIVDNIVTSHHGRILKKMGDAVFAVFDSPVDALNCAITIQNQLKARNDTGPAPDRILIRIGLHHGDVVTRDNDLFGADVNVAARLEPLAEPGGICISEAVYEAVKDQMGSKIVKVGDVELKNILQKYVIYKIPSLYGEEFAAAKKSAARKSGASDDGRRAYRVKRIDNLPVASLSPMDLMLFTTGFCAFFLVGLAWFIEGTLNVQSLLAFIREKPLWILILLVALNLCTIYFYANKAIRVIFDDLRDVDGLLDYLVTRIGYHSSVREGGQLMFKPSLYQFIMYSARKIYASVDGTSVILSGNYMFINKLTRIIQSCETPR
jgi:class 3 adenylate cyclase